MAQKIWSDWVPCSGTPTLEARFAKFTPDKITLELKNTGTGLLEGEYTANECADNQKDISGWQKAKIQPGESIKLTFGTGGCDKGFHWWARNVYIWSGWSTLNPDKFVSYRWIKRGSKITVELVNNDKISWIANFNANFCDEKSKGSNGWKSVSMPSGKSVTVDFTDGTAARCNAGFHLWYKTMRKQQIDDGTELVPAGN